jgi:SAM-dependent methyltransferase
VTQNPACPACGAPGFEVLFESTDRLYRVTDRKFRVVECERCRLLRLEPRPTLAEIAQFYPENYWFEPDQTAAGRLEEAYRRIVLGDHVSFVRRAIEDAHESGPVLDVGCGGGLFLRILREHGATVLGLDHSQQAASVAWRANGVPALRGDLVHAPLPASSCAAITMFQVLEHLTNPIEYLDAARELLRPRGRLIVQTPNAACWQFLMLGENWSGIDIPRHLLDFRARDLEALLESRGFEVLRRKHFSLRDNPAGLATSLAPWLDPMARRLRRVRESHAGKLAKDFLYLALVVAALPFTVVEAACRAGSTIMLEARKKA